MINPFKELEEKYGIEYIIKDAVLASFPKSGRTWLRMILAKLLDLKGIDTDEYEFLPVFHKSSSEIKNNFKDIKLKVVFLKRHCGDTAVSYFREHEDKHGKIYIFDQDTKNIISACASISEFFRHVIPEIITFNNWWISNPYNQKILYISYEEMQENTFLVIKKVVDFLEFDCTEEQIIQAIEYSTFDNMKKIENGEGFDYLRGYKGNFSGNSSLENRPRIRKGKVGSYLEELNKEDIQFVESYENLLLKRQNLVKKRVDGFDWILDVADGGIGPVLVRSKTTGIGADFAREKLFMLTLDSVVKEGMTCIDIGANIGYATMFMLRNSGKTGDVYAIEPDNHNLALIGPNLVINGYDTTKLTKCLISDKDGESDFWIARHPNLNSVVKTKHSIRKETIECVTLATYCETRNIYPNFIKMDIEGHEVSVFNGAYEFFKKNRGETH